MEARVKDPLCQAPSAPQTIQKGPPDVHNCSLGRSLVVPGVLGSVFFAQTPLSVSVSLSSITFPCMVTPSLFKTHCLYNPTSNQQTDKSLVSLERVHIPQK